MFIGSYPFEFFKLRLTAKEPNANNQMNKSSPGPYAPGPLHDDTLLDLYKEPGLSQDVLWIASRGAIKSA